MKRRRFSVQEYVDGVVKGNRSLLARTITLIESRNSEDRVLADQILEQLIPEAGNSFRIGITGVPGAGKSTFINQFGKNICDKGHKVAVLTIDPTSVKSGGSILGDKTRMTELSQEPNSFIRPSPSSGVLGGVNRYTREAILVCEAGGFDTILIETVGVGQNELAIESMTDLTLLITITGAGDELQSIKKGIIEIADFIAINKSDGDNVIKARQYAQELKQILYGNQENQNQNIFCCSSIRNDGLEKIWNQMQKEKDSRILNGQFKEKREGQIVDWLNTEIVEYLKNAFYNQPGIKEAIDQKIKKLIDHQGTVTISVSELMKQFLSNIK